MDPELQLLLIRGKTDKKTLLSAIEALPHDLGTLPESVIKDLADLVPQMAGLLDLRRQLGDFCEAHTELITQLDALADGELDHRLWQIEYKVCQLLPQLGPRARLAVPLLFEHLERYPRFELNAWAIGKIGGPGVAGRLMEWTYWGKYPHDRKCFDSVCGAIHALGESAIAEFLEIASPCNDSVHQRYAALLNLVHNTDYPVERCIPLITSELERGADGNVDSACRKVLRDCLIWLGNQNAEAVSAGIEPLLFEKSAASEDFISVLSELGPVAIPLLTRAVEQNVHEYSAITALAKIGGEGLDYLYAFIPGSMNRLLVGRAVRSIPIDDKRTPTVLMHTIEMWRTDWKFWGLLRRLALRRLDELGDVQSEIAIFLKSLNNDPDPSIVGLADTLLNKTVNLPLKGDKDKVVES